MSLFRTTTPFLQNNAWQNQSLNALRYNTSQIGSVLPLVYGTVRQAVNLIALGGYSGPGGGKKGKGVGPLPIGGTNTVQGKGGGGKGKGKGKGKGNQDYSVDVAFGMCIGPVTFNASNLIFANGAVEAFGASGAGAGKGTSGNHLNFWQGSDGQSGDPTFNGIGSGLNYSGTCWITGTPMDLGKSPAIPNIQFEITGILAGNASGPSFPADANPALVINDFLTNVRYGANFPAALLDDITNPVETSFLSYCQAAGLLISVSLDGQQRALEWLDGLCRLLNTAIVWSGKLLHFIPRGDIALSGNGNAWQPNLTPQYALTDDDFLPWHAHDTGPNPGEDDPIIVTRSNPADAFNRYRMEYLDRANFYNSTILEVYDQGAIDQYGGRDGDTLPGKCFANATSAQVSAQLILQRTQYIRSTYRWQAGWKYCLLEPMDIVLLTGSAGDSYLVKEATRITSIEENENGDLTFEAEEVVIGQGPTSPPSLQPPTPAPSPLPRPTFSTASGAWGGAGNWGIGNPSGTMWFPYSTVVGGVPVPAGVTTPGPSVVVAWVCYEQRANSAGGYFTGQNPDPVVLTVTSPSLGGFSRRSEFVMYPDWADGYENCIYKLEQWWAPAPTALSNEVVTAAVDGRPYLGAIFVAAVSGFSATGITKPWDCLNAVMAANWSTDYADTALDHFYTGHANGVMLQAALLYPQKSDPGGGPSLVDYGPLGYNVGGLSPAYAITESKEEGLPQGAMCFQFCGFEYFTQYVNAHITGNLLTTNGSPGVWPEWMLTADALYLS